MKLEIIAVYENLDGYFFGYKIIDSFRKLYPKISIKNMIEMNSEEIFSMSNYHL